MSIRQVRKNEAQPCFARMARDEPEQSPASADSLPMEEIAFLAAWEKGRIPCPAASLRVRQLQRANPGLFVVLLGGAPVDKPERSLRSHSDHKPQPEVKDHENPTARDNGRPDSRKRATR